MARHALPPIGHSIHGQSKAELMRLHQQSLERTLNNTLTIIDEKYEQQKQQRVHNKKKKKYYPWLQRDSQTQREKIGLEGSRRRQRHDNDKFIHHPMAVLYAVDMPFPGYGHDAPSFHWKYDAMIDSLIRNNPPSSRRSKVANENDDAITSGPMIGHRCLTRAQRKDIKKVHVPQGIVMQYEGELVGFLDQLSLSTSTFSSSSSDACNSEQEEEDEEEGNNIDDDDVSEPELVAPSDSTDGDDQVDAKSSWIFVQKPKEPIVAASERDESSRLEKYVEVEQDRPQVYLRWDIPDQFLRFVAHALCSFYGLVSFSKTADGKRWVYICHPTHLESIGPLSRQKALEHVQELPMPELEKLWGTIDAKKVDNCLRPEMTFFEYLYPSTRPSF